MTEQHSITPTLELIAKWASSFCGYHEAARWGADQELEACEKYWMTHGISPEGVVRMREARRPKPPSLKEQALEVLERCCFVNPKHEDIIRRALEALPE